MADLSGRKQAVINWLVSKTALDCYQSGGQLVWTNSSDGRVASMATDVGLTVASPEVALIDIRRHFGMPGIMHPEFFPGDEHGERPGLKEYRDWGI